MLLDSRKCRDVVGSRAICQQRDVLDVWESVGAGAEIARRGVTWTTARTFHGDRELFSVEFADRGRSPFPPFVNISQCETERVLDERIALQPLITVRWNAEVTTIDQDETGVRVTAGGDTIEGSYAVACPGARGDRIRAQLGVTFDGESFDDHFLICDIRTDLPGWQTERRFYFDPVWNPGRQVLIHPCPDDTFRIDWQVPSTFDLETDDLDARIHQVIGDRPYEMLWKSVYRFHSRMVDRMRVGRVLLAGDAAHLVSPFGARGLNSGVLDAENAAWKIAFVARGMAPESLLESYHVERHAAAAENLAVTAATMRFLVPPTSRDARRRQEILTRAAIDPSARGQVDSGRLAEPFWYVDSPLTTPDPSRPFPGRPARGDVPVPAPGILVPDCPITTPAPSVPASSVPAPSVLTASSVSAAGTGSALMSHALTPAAAASAAPTPRAFAVTGPGPAPVVLAAPSPAAGATSAGGDLVRLPAVSGGEPARSGRPAGASDVVGGGGRLREIARAGIVVLVGDGATVPLGLGDLVAVHRMSDLDPGSGLSDALGAEPGEIWLLRPDAHVAAVVRSAREVGPALARMLNRPEV
jgi:2-polyprenyl-6-methoxyphenol hydroxylase-like FAD-dependent oxidoreductase